MILAKIHVTLKASVLDPQGEAIGKSLHVLGYEEVHDVRVGKMIEIQLKTDDWSAAEERVRQMCERLLANTVIEKYSFELVEGAQ